MRGGEGKGVGTRGDLKGRGREAKQRGEGGGGFSSLFSSLLAFTTLSLGSNPRPLSPSPDPVSRDHSPTGVVGVVHTLWPGVKSYDP
jgi:hypothetical protein